LGFTPGTSTAGLARFEFVRLRIVSGATAAGLTIFGFLTDAGAALFADLRSILELSTEIMESERLADLGARHY
jgi:hypothetical protein